MGSSFGTKEIINRKLKSHELELKGKLNLTVSRLYQEKPNVSITFFTRALDFNFFLFIGIPSMNTPTEGKQCFTAEVFKP